MTPVTARTESLAKVMDLIGSKYSVLLLHYLCESGPQRFKDCQEMHAISTRTLTQRLHELEGAGLIEKKEYREYPPRTEYSATDKGRGLAQTFGTVIDWASKNL